MLRKKFTDWKAYTIVTIVFWFVAIVMAGSVFGDLILATSAITAILAFVFIVAEIFRTSEKSVFQTRGRDATFLALAIVILLVVANNISNLETARVLSAITPLSGIILVFLIVLSLVSFIRGRV